MEVSQSTHGSTHETGWVLDSGGKKPLQIAGFRSEGSTQSTQSNPETQSFSYKRLTKGLYESGLLLVTWLLPSTTGLGLGYDVMSEKRMKEIDMSEEFIAGSRLYPLAGSIEREESVFGYRSMRRLTCPVCGHENAHLGRPEFHESNDGYEAG